MENIMNKTGYFGNWGGAFIPEVLHQTFEDLKEEYQKAKADRPSGRNICL
jgi:tryptophan synthase beta chain